MNAVISDVRIGVDEYTWNGTTYTGSADGKADYYRPKVVSATDYYPFGWTLPERSFNSGDYRFGFQGQQTDPEYFGGGVFFKYRVHDPRLGRFLSVDPLFKEYAYNSTYAFSENRVVDAVEIEGLEADVLNESLDGNAQHYMGRDGQLYNPYTSIGGELVSPPPLTCDEPIRVVPGTNLVWEDNRAQLTSGGRELMSEWANSESYIGIFSYSLINSIYGSLQANPFASVFIKNPENLDGTLMTQRQREEGTVGFLTSTLPAIYSAGKSLSYMSFYRSMGKDAAETFLLTGKMPPGTETFIATSKSFAQNYTGTLFRITVRPGTFSQLESIGVRNVASGHPFRNLPLVSRGWKTTNAFFKVEGGYLNIGLGNGQALDIFNSNIHSFSIVR